MMGPSHDPDGAKWNALPRRGDSPTVAREQIAAEILALTEVFKAERSKGPIRDDWCAAYWDRVEWLIAQPVPEVR
jgi:hypothetical protein